MRISHFIFTTLTLLALQSCFTGVESTPRITASDVKKEKIVVSPEQEFLSEVHPQAPALWSQGKEFYVVDPKIHIIFSSASESAHELKTGDIITFEGFQPATSVTGQKVTEMLFSSPSGGLLVYRDNLPFDDIPSRTQLDVPFTVEKSLIDTVAAAIKGNRYYTVTPLWYTPDGENAEAGLRYSEVKIADVLPGNSAYPLRIVFEDASQHRLHSMFMTVGNQRISTRNFHTLFAFDNPRSKYPHITDDNWALITRSKVKNGMTREECKLALGAPQTIGQHPGRSQMYEIWGYSDGITLLFEEGYLIDLKHAI